ncbi:MAG: hypothetical protein WBL63_04765 [Candidatus Acidiferrum sp.]
MSIQLYPSEFNYARTKLEELCGQFLRMFLLSCLKAGSEDYELLRPALTALQEKYPVGRGVKLTREEDTQLKVRIAGQ